MNQSKRPLNQEKGSLLLTNKLTAFLKSNPENTLANEIIAFLASEKEPFSRETAKGHITSSAWLISPDEKEVLLTHHKKLGIWIQLGGHCDGLSETEEVALKEAREESGIENLELVSNDIFDVDVHWIPDFKGTPGHWHYDIRYVIKSMTKSVKKNEESLELAWFDILFLAQADVEQSVKRMAKKWIALKQGYKFA